MYIYIYIYTYMYTYININTYKYISLVYKSYIPVNSVVFHPRPHMRNSAFKGKRQECSPPGYKLGSTAWRPLNYKLD